MIACRLGSINVAIIEGGQAFLLGGYGVTSLSAIDNFDFTTEVASVHSQSLDSTTHNFCGSSSLTAGYTFGGNTTALSHTATVNKITFASGIVNLVGDVLANTTSSAASMSDKSTIFIVGGLNPSATTDTQKFTIGSETSASIASTILTVYGAASFDGDSVNGYYAHGVINGIAQNYCYSLGYSTDVITYIGHGNNSTSLPASISGQTRGYLVHGANSVLIPKITGLHYGSGTALNVSEILSATGYYETGVQSTIKGYAVGGTAGGNRMNIIRGFNLETETGFSVTSTLAIAKDQCAGVSEEGNAVFTPVPQPQGDGLVLTSSASLDGYGIVFANDTVWQLYTGNLYWHQLGAGMRAPLGGYATGGDGGYKKTDFVDFATLSRTDLSDFTISDWYLQHGLESASAGYYAGQYFGGSEFYEKTVFSSNTGSTLAAALGAARNKCTGVSSSTIGYSCGGTFGGDDKIDALTFSSDTSNLLGTVLSVASVYGTGTYSNSNGYISGVASYNTNVDKLIYASTSVSQIGAVLNLAFSNRAGVVDSSKGYICGGSGETRIEILDYATDTSTISSESFLFDMANSVGI